MIPRPNINVGCFIELKNKAEVDNARIFEELCQGATVVRKVLII